MDTTAKPHPILQILQFPIVRLLILGPLLFVAIGVSNGFMVKYATVPLVALVAAAGMSIAGLIVYWTFVRFIEQRPVRELSFSGMGLELGAGILIGAGLCVVCVLILMAQDVYRIEGFRPLVFALPALAMALSSGVLEELMYRGVLFRIVEETFGSWIALAVSALVFGLSHYSSQEGALMGAIAISIEAGILLAAAYMMTRRLWLGIGLHMAWNFAQSGVFSGIVSGAFNQPGLVKSTIEGPSILTGGAFGLEASLVAVLVCIVAGLAMLIVSVRRGHIVPPCWKRGDQD
ncbi:MAG: lysostaphin resistance A-like protein [Beijerinckiaceae bacterium]